jgi:hypothetical protein
VYDRFSGLVSTLKESAPYVSLQARKNILERLSNVNIPDDLKKLLSGSDYIQYSDRARIIQLLTFK